MEDELYTWDSTGGCELCDSMDILHDVEPTRPHPNCDCVINSFSSCCSSYVLVVLDLDFELETDREGNPIRYYDYWMEVEINIICKEEDNDGITEIHRIDFTGLEFSPSDLLPDSDILLELAMGDICEIVEEMCEQCAQDVM